MLFQQPAFRTIYDENRALFMVSIVNKSFTAFNAVRIFLLSYLVATLLTFVARILNLVAK